MATDIAFENIPREAGDGRTLKTLVRLYRIRFSRLTTPVLYLLAATVIYSGWQFSGERPLTAEHGPGYALGITGASLMLMLMLYPLRKHARFMQRMGKVSYWFRMHMLLGILGPVCILFHSSFRLGSTNSNVALFCMLAVASSGLVGRHLYTRIHHGLYGRKASLQELREHADKLGASLGKLLETSPRIAARLEKYEARATHPPAGIIGSFLFLCSLGMRTWFSYTVLRLSTTRSLPGAQRRILLQHIGARMECIRKLAQFQFYTRLFSAWHVLHFPLFLMMILSGCIHVVAVHMY